MLLSEVLKLSWHSLSNGAASGTTISEICVKVFLFFFQISTDLTRTYNHHATSVSCFFVWAAQIYFLSRGWLITFTILSKQNVLLWNRSDAPAKVWAFLNHTWYGGLKHLGNWNSLTSSCSILMKFSCFFFIQLILKTFSFCALIFFFIITFKNQCLRNCISGSNYQKLLKCFILYIYFTRRFFYGGTFTNIISRA